MRKYYPLIERVLCVLSIMSLLLMIASYILWLEKLVSFELVGVIAVLSIAICTLFPLFIALSSYFAFHKVESIYKRLGTSLKLLLVWGAILFGEVWYNFITGLGRHKIVDFIPTLCVAGFVVVIILTVTVVIFKNRPALS